MITEPSMLPKKPPNESSVADRRRSDRILLTVPIRAEGADRDGHSFECEARALSISRHGARVLIPQILNKGQAVRLKNSTGDYQADFRVTATITASTPKGAEYVVECVDEKENFWKIDFPSPDQDGATDAKVLVECRRCETLALMPMTLSELEALRAMGLVGKYCHYCNTTSLWKYAHVGMSPYVALEMAQRANGGAPDPASPPEPTPRSHRRIYVLMPVVVRDAQGNEEKTRTENISKGGFCFASEKAYQLGDPVLAIFPGDELGQKTEIPARIVRTQPVEGSHRKIYGAEYDHS